MTNDAEVTAIASEIKAVRDRLTRLIAPPQALRDVKAIVAAKSEISVLERKRAALLAPPPPPPVDDEEDEDDEEDADFNELFDDAEDC